MMIAAKRYAEGLMRLGTEENKTEKLLYDLLRVYELFKMNKEFVDLLFDDKVKQSEKKDKIKKILGNSVDVYIINLICLLIDKKREVLLPYIPLYYKQMYDKMVGNVEVEVVVANEIDESLLKKITTWLSKRYGIKNPKFNVKIDRNVIGGIKLLFNNIEVDATIKGALESIKYDLIQKVV